MKVRQKVDSRQVQSRNYEDTFAGSRYSLNMAENEGSVAAVSLYQCTLRTQPRAQRQTQEEQDFWNDYLDR